MHKRIMATAIITAVPVLALLGGRVAANPQTAPALVKAASARILVNAQGMTLYIFTQDKQNQSTCTGQCAAYWPPVLLANGAGAPTSITGVQGTLGVATRADGQRQLTYNGAPLYTFSKDKVPGDITGQGVQGVWWIEAVPATSAHPADAVATPTKSTGNDNQSHRHGGAQRAATPRAKCYYGSCSGATPTPAGSYYGGGGHA